MDGMGVEKSIRGYIPHVLTTARLLADRRHGVDRRAVPRRLIVAHVPPERRSVVDRRHGAERRSTLERRGRPLRRPSVESPGEHLRNALQLLGQLAAAREPMVDAAVARVRRALALLQKPR
jgi:hypothetical protein